MQSDALSLGFRAASLELAVRPAVRYRECVPDSHLPEMPAVLHAAASFPRAFAFVAAEGCDAERAGAEASVGVNATADAEAAARAADAAGGALRALLDSELPTAGAVLVRGLPITDARGFSLMMHATNLSLVDYIGGVTSRPVLAPKVMPTSTESHLVSMEPHVDNPYWPRPPTHLAVYARRPVPVGEGGQSIATDTRAVWQTLREEQPELLAELRARRVRYLHFYPEVVVSQGSSPSWQNSFAAACAGQAPSACNATKLAERTLRAGGFGFEWVPHTDEREAGLLKWEVDDAVKRHPATGEELWANMITAMHCSVFDNHPGYPELNRCRGAPNRPPPALSDPAPPPAGGRRCEPRRARCAARCRTTPPSATAASSACGCCTRCASRSGNTA